MGNLRKIFQEHTKNKNKERNKLIIEEYKKGVSEKDISKMFKVHYSTIHLIIRNYKEKNK